jgi:hypothetical protein
MGKGLSQGSKLRTGVEWQNLTLDAKGITHLHSDRNSNTRNLSKYINQWNESS